MIKESLLKNIVLLLRHTGLQEYPLRYKCQELETHSSLDDGSLMSAGSTQGFEKREKRRKGKERKKTFDNHSQFITKNQNLFLKVKISFLDYLHKIKDLSSGFSCPYFGVLPHEGS